MAAIKSSRLSILVPKFFLNTLAFSRSHSYFISVCRLSIHTLSPVNRHHGDVMNISLLGQLGEFMTGLSRAACIRQRQRLCEVRSALTQMSMSCSALVRGFVKLAHLS